jgi:hypothetical protein
LEKAGSVREDFSTPSRLDKDSLEFGEEKGEEN